MSRLFAANMMRLKKSKLLWFLAVAAAASSLALVILLILYPDSIDKIMFCYPVLIAFMIPAFIGIFFGTEYSDGTLRNKLMVGHSRKNIYLANLLTALFAAYILLAAYLLPVLLLGFPALGVPSMDWGTVIMMLLASMITIGAICSIHVMISMIISNKTNATVINLALAFLSYEVTAILFSMSTVMTGIGADICQLITNILPMGQAVQFIMGGMNTPLWLLAVYAIAVTIIFTVTGMKVFSTKNIK